MIIGWTDDLIAGAMSMGNLGLGNFVACIFCLWYLIKKMNCMLQENLQQQ